MTETLSDVGPEIGKPPRKLSRAARRTQLIEATLDVMAAQGYARTTLTEVAKRAGLSHGLVNFHFATKEGLLAETLAFLAEEYRANWAAALNTAAPDPASQIAALICADFEPAICTPAKLSAWCAFWGEAQSRPLYQASCGSNDEAYNAMVEGFCARLIAAGGYDANPILAARVMRVTQEGVWLDMMTMNHPYDRAEGLRTVFACAAAFFPRHFDENGLLTGAKS